MVSIGRFQRACNFVPSISAAAAMAAIGFSSRNFQDFFNRFLSHRLFRGKQGFDSRQYEQYVDSCREFPLCVFVWHHLLPFKPIRINRISASAKWMIAVYLGGTRSTNWWLAGIHKGNLIPSLFVFCLRDLELPRSSYQQLFGREESSRLPSQNNQTAPVIFERDCPPIRANAGLK